MNFFDNIQTGDSDIVLILVILTFVFVLIPARFHYNDLLSSDFASIVVGGLARRPVWFFEKHYLVFGFWVHNHNILESFISQYNFFKLFTV
jgi:hypothetical protein